MSDGLRVAVLRTLLGPLRGVFCRVRLHHAEHLPGAGGALLVANLHSAVDAALLQTSLPRPAIFAANSALHDHPWTRCLARLMRFETVAGDASPEELAGFAERLRKEIAAGEWVCVTREARLVPGGATVPWHADYGVLAGDAPVVPVHLDRLWEMFYTFDRGNFEFAKRRRLALRYPVDICVGPAQSDSSGVSVRDAVRRIGTDWRMERPTRFPTLRRAFIVSCRRFLFRPSLGDALVGHLSFFKTLVGAIVFARKLRPLIGDAPMVGILLPPSVGAALANFALHLLGRSPIHLNYSIRSEDLASSAAKCGIRHTVTSRRFLEKVPLVPPGEAIYLEELRGSVGGMDRLKAMLGAMLLPAASLERSLGGGPGKDSDIATVIFSSGSEGTPKGVVLTERNILSNIESVMEVLPRHKKSCFVGFLPFFHSFGYTVTLWLPVLGGVRAIYHPNPLEPRIIGDLVREHHGTIMCGTSTFLQNFVRRCTSEQLESLELVVAGAEKLAMGIRVAFTEKFGVEPVEAYGATECSPGVTANMPNLVSPGYYHDSLRRGTIGLPFPGVDVRIVHPQTRVPVPVGQSGMLEARGPNVMQGYLGMPEKTAAVIRDGWYETGDIAQMDEDGFVSITGRLARFSKIGGEMVPHVRIEEALHTLLELGEQRMAVSSVSDPAKGERVVVLHTLEAPELDRLLTRLPTSDLPNLWRPKSNAFIRVDSIPILGSGKLDIQGVKRLAESLAGGE